MKTRRSASCDIQRNSTASVEDEGEEEETEEDFHTAVNQAVDDYDGG